MKQPCTLLRTVHTAISPQDQLRSGTPTAHERVALPLLPSGPGGVRRFPLRGAQPSTPPHEAHSTRTALEREFNPAEADCGLQGTANSPSSTATLQTTAIRAGSPGKCEKVAEGVGFEPTAQGLAPCTAFPVPHLRPLGHPSGLSCVLIRRLRDHLDPVILPHGAAWRQLIRPPLGPLLHGLSGQAARRRPQDSPTTSAGRPSGTRSGQGSRARPP
jgi:hypothetical protein